MGRQPCCDKVGLKKGPWTSDEDKKLMAFMLTNGQCCWRAVPKLAGLLRCGKSCRLRWTNYLRPDLKRGLLSEDEEKMVIDLHAQLGNRWSKVASHLPGRTDNEIKNHWNTHIKKKLRKMGIDPLTHNPLPPTQTPQPAADQPPAPPRTGNEDKTTSPVDSSQVSTVDDINNIADFSIDEIPVVEPHEILLTSDEHSLTPSSCSSSSSSSSSLYPNSWPSDLLEDLQFSENLEDYGGQIMNTYNIWEDDFCNGLDFFGDFEVELTRENAEMIGGSESWEFDVN